MADILVIGSINADLVVRAPYFPKPGETISGGDLQIIPGGKGANQAVAAARQGASVALIGRVGKDNFGSLLLQNLKSDSVDTSGILIDDSATGTAVIIVDDHGQNSIVLSAGANANLSPADVERASSFNPSLLLLQMEIPTPTVLYAARYAKQKGIRVLLNPAPAQPLSKELLDHVDFIVPNETELSLLTGMKIDGIDSAEKGAKELIAQGVSNVVVTLGAKGALVATREKMSHIQPYSINAIDTTAAGDSFIGGFASALLRGENVEEAVKYANACGALAAAKFGAQTSLPTFGETMDFIAEIEKIH